ncbi:DUF4129 domain-containing protein [Hufsiella ginkgonis]|uniref:DUF4129 domain-containing protein n=1 Tax=Hufsiella ginkgonis TaxID=2695274 RepID=A0A7K1Y4B8_9SPHI|nr:DUF4129 domain-containing protein [Hufsiella ginkgonis]MXV17556.1 DUF4129 domain-containing protein [Hufsiella ginkgonis]
MRFFLAVLLCFASWPAYGSGNPSPVKATIEQQVAVADTSAFTARSFNERQLGEYRRSPAFIYRDNGVYAGQSLWSRFWRWFWGLFEGITSAPVTGNLFKILFWGLGIAGSIYAFLKLIGMDPIQVFTRKPTGIEVPYEESLENIHEISFDDEIERAAGVQNYRLAVRLLYLSSLKYLSDSGMIHWQNDKTNGAYLQELANTDKKEQFSVLTRQFEYIWYGNFPVQPDAFQEIRGAFKHFTGKK